jgi:hypothetical protein
MKPVAGFSGMLPNDQIDDCTGGAELKKCSCTGGMLVCDCVGCLKVT